jgi:hypothetical protein
MNASFANMVMEQTRRLTEFYNDACSISLDIWDHNCGKTHRTTEWSIWNSKYHVKLEGGSLSDLSAYVDKLIRKREILFRKF